MLPADTCIFPDYHDYVPPFLSSWMHPRYWSIVLVTNCIILYLAKMSSKMITVICFHLQMRPVSGNKDSYAMKEKPRAGQEMWRSNKKLHQGKSTQVWGVPCKPQSVLKLYMLQKPPKDPYIWGKKLKCEVCQANFIQSKNLKTQRYPQNTVGEEMSKYHVQDKLEVWIATYTHPSWGKNIQMWCMPVLVGLKALSTT